LFLLHSRSDTQKSIDLKWNWSKILCKSCNHIADYPGLIYGLKDLKTVSNISFHEKRFIFKHILYLTSALARQLLWFWVLHEFFSRHILGLSFRLLSMYNIIFNYQFSLIIFNKILYEDDINKGFNQVRNVIFSDENQSLWLITRRRSNKWNKRSGIRENNKIIQQIRDTLEISKQRKRQEQYENNMKRVAIWNKTRNQSDNETRSISLMNKLLWKEEATRQYTDMHPKIVFVTVDQFYERILWRDPIRSWSAFQIFG